MSWSFINIETQIESWSCLIIETQRNLVSILVFTPEILSQNTLCHPAEGFSTVCILGCIEFFFFNILFAYFPKMGDWVWVNKRKKQNANPRPGTVFQIDPKIAQTPLKVKKKFFQTTLCGYSKLVSCDTWCNANFL